MRALCALLLLTYTLQIYPTFAQTQTRRVFLFEDIANRQWCALDNESAASAAIQKANASTVATATYLNRHLSQLELAEAGESGDWIVFDTYFFGDGDRLTELARVINDVSDNVSALQTFSLSSGKPVKVATTMKDLDTGKSPASKIPEWLPDLPVRTRVREFPFATLLDRRELSKTANICVPTSGEQ